MEVAVHATWDPEACVVAGSDDVPGLVTEAGDIEALGVALGRGNEVAFVLTASRYERAARYAA